MLRWLGKMLLFRILPRKLLPVLTVIEVARFLRNARNPRTASDAPRLGDPRGPAARRGRVVPAGRAVPGGLGFPSLRPATRERRVVGASGPELPAPRGGGATVPR